MATKKSSEQSAGDSAGASAPSVQAPPARGSVLDSLRHNRMGTLTVALVVALVMGLLLSVLVPRQLEALAMVLLGIALAAAVGFSVRYVSLGKGVLTQATALVATLLGVHVMAVTGGASGTIPLLESLGATGPSFGDVLLLALATPAISAGGVLAGLVAAIIAGWGPQAPERVELD